MNIEESMEHEAIKSLFMLMIYRNNQLTTEQKKLAMDKIDIASKQADWIMEILKACGYIK